MSNEYDLYHGTKGDNILSIINDGLMRPDAGHKVYFSERLEDSLQHGGDLKRKATFAFKARITVPSGASLARVATPGNCLAVLITTAIPLPAKLIELYVRLPREHEVKIIRGVETIKAYLLRASS